MKCQDKLAEALYRGSVEMLDALGIVAHSQGFGRPITIDNMPPLTAEQAEAWQEYLAAANLVNVKREGRDAK
jgi:hypothetical protein